MLEPKTPSEDHAASDFSDLANCIRALSIDAVEAAKSGHPGAPLGMADAATVLFSSHLKFDPGDPNWPDRDRFVLSNGHASMLLYSVLYLTGFSDMTKEELQNFRQWGSKTAGHPEYGHAAGVETTTGPLGQGLANGVGMAIAEKILSSEFGPDLVNHRTFAFVGDGCLQEGIGQEAVSLAGHLGLGKLIVLYDDNGITIDGPTDISFSENVPERFKACGWHVVSCDGHNPSKINDALDAAKAETDRPSLIALKTVIGFGSPNKAGSASSHGAPLGADECNATKAALNWSAVPFEIPQPLLQRWRSFGDKGRTLKEQWQSRFDEMNEDVQSKFKRRIEQKIPDAYQEAYDELASKLIAEPSKIATRRASQLALEKLSTVLPEMIGGSADLTGSNLTRTSSMDGVLSKSNPSRYIGYGVREFGMAAIMNGMALHGGVIPYGGTFLVFSDYARNAIRMSALMGVGVIYVMTHDSIGLGEDGPTHQPIEQLASLRAIPNLRVFRPCDPVETLECWDLAIRNRTAPSVLALSRQAAPQLRDAVNTEFENQSAKGGYVIWKNGAGEDISILSTGTEVSVAVEAARALSATGYSVRVVSMPCWELFDSQPTSYQDETMGPGAKIAIEAASKFGWTRYVDSEDDVIGMTTFGASAPAETLYEKFGITKESVVERALSLLSARGSNR